MERGKTNLQTKALLGSTTERPPDAGPGESLDPVKCDALIQMRKKTSLQRITYDTDSKLIFFFLISESLSEVPVWSS